MNSPAASAPFPVGRFLLVIAATAGALLLVGTIVRIGGLIDAEIYKGVILGLCTATLSHVLGTFAGAFFAARMLAAGNGGGSLISAYLASTTVRFIATPALALSLYFLLPQKPAPLFLGAAVGHLLIMVADIATVMKYLQGSARSSAPNA
jgi:hypothetical protein